MSFPIIFIHKGYSDYMEYSLRQAKITNPNSEIILLGDDANNKFPFIRHENISNYFATSEKFSSIYKHNSTNPYHYELFCIQRWFVLYEFMSKNDILESFVIDTDIMVYSDIEKALLSFDKNKIPVIEFDNNYSYASAYVTTKSLKSLTCFINKKYKNPDSINEFNKYYQNLLSSKKLGGISDMTLVEDWINEIIFKKNIQNLIAVNNDSTFDLHISMKQHSNKNDIYKFGTIRKKINFIKKIPYGYHLKLKKEIKFHTLHFQGPAKYLMSKYYTGNTFKGKTKLDIKFFFANIAAYWYKKLKIRYRFAWLFKIIFEQKAKQ